MARPLRLEFPGAIYHMTARSAHRASWRSSACFFISGSMPYLTCGHNESIM